MKLSKLMRIVVIVVWFVVRPVEQVQMDNVSSAFSFTDSLAQHGVMPIVIEPSNYSTFDGDINSAIQHILARINHTFRAQRPHLFQTNRNDFRRPTSQIRPFNNEATTAQPTPSPRHESVDVDEINSVHRTPLLQQNRPFSANTSTLHTPRVRKKREGELRLVGGQTLFEGNVEINHLGLWGSICDDEWDMDEANVACRQLGFVLGALKSTTDSRFGKSRSKSLSASRFIQILWC